MAMQRIQQYVLAEDILNKEQYSQLSVKSILHYFTPCTFEVGDTLAILPLLSPHPHCLRRFFCVSFACIIGFFDKSRLNQYLYFIKSIARARNSCLLEGQ